MLRIDKLTKNYGKFPALKGLTLEVPDGALHGFVGPNGAGKTTTMRILATLMPPTSGTAYVDGTDVTREGQKARKLVGYMPDFFGVYDSLTCREYLDFYARCYRIGATERKRMGSQLLELVQLQDKENEYVDALSRGMKQRLCLARSLIHDPKLLILDEPASGMDPRARAEMKGILRTLREMGKSVLVSSHILPELSEMCDSLTILDHGPDERKRPAGHPPGGGCRRGSRGRGGPVPSGTAVYHGDPAGRTFPAAGAAGGRRGCLYGRDARTGEPERAGV